MSSSLVTGFLVGLDPLAGFVFHHSGVAVGVCATGEDIAEDHAAGARWIPLVHAEFVAFPAAAGAHCRRAVIEERHGFVAVLVVGEILNDVQRFRIGGRLIFVVVDDDPLAVQRFFAVIFGGGGVPRRLAHRHRIAGAGAVA